MTTCCDTPLILASASPRRRKILKAMGLAFDVVAPPVVEVLWDDRPVATVCENAKRKWAWARGVYAEATIIAADTVVMFEGQSIGKPDSVVDAVEMLRRFSGKSQTVFTAVAMAARTRPLSRQVAKAVVHFRDLTDVAIEQYVRLVDPLDKAGGYDIDQYGELIIRGYEGSWTTIMGLPKGIVEAWLACGSEP